MENTNAAISGPISQLFSNTKEKNEYHKVDYILRDIKKVKSNVSEVGFEPTPTFVDQNTLI